MKNKRNNKFSRMTAIFLSALMIFSCLPLASLAADVTPDAGYVGDVVDPELREQYMSTFNYVVNGIKRDRPSFVIEKNVGLDKNDLDNPVLDGEAERFLTVFLDSIFNPDRGIIKNLFQAIAEEDTAYEKKEVPKNVDTKYLVPLKGTNIVSELDSQDDFRLSVKEDNAKGLTAVRCKFKDATLEEVKKDKEDPAYDEISRHPLHKVFDLPSGTLNPVVISGSVFPDKEEGPLKDVELEDFRFKNAEVQILYDDNDTLIKYEQKISYSFSLSFYDAIRIISAYTNFDFLKVALAIANPILEGVGKPELDEKDVLKETKVTFSYKIVTTMSGFDWAPRYFGDVDDNGKIEAKDARMALRQAVNLKPLIRDKTDLVYTDVDFSGKIQASDARRILRMAVYLEDWFKEVPEGETIKIVEFKPPKPLPEPEPKPEVKPGEEDKPLVPDGADQQLADQLDSLVSGIIAIITELKSDDGLIKAIIAEIQTLIDSIHKINEA